MTKETKQLLKDLVFLLDATVAFLMAVWVCTVGILCLTDHHRPSEYAVFACLLCGVAWIVSRTDSR